MFGQDLFVLGAGLLTLAGGMICPGARIPEVRLEYRVAAPVYDYSYNAEELEALAMEYRKRASYTSQMLGEEGWHTAGFTHVKTQSSLHIPPRTVNDRQTGMTCLMFDEVELTMQLEQTVYLDKNQESCEAEVTKQHEMEHVAANQVILNTYRARLQAWAAAEAGRYFYRIKTGPFRSGDAGEIYRQVNAHFKSGFDRILEEMDGAIRESQMAIDSEENYRALDEVCNRH